MTESTDTDLLAKVTYNLIAQAEAFRDTQKSDRDKALDFYRGKPEAVPFEAGFSSVVSKDLRSAIRKVMPSVMRTLLGNDNLVEYSPRKPGDEEAAKQATDYVNAVVVEESEAEKGIYDAIMDAFLLKTGILTWASYETSRVAMQTYRDQPEEAMIGLDEAGEILDMQQTGAGQDGQALYSFRLRRMDRKVCTTLRAVPRGSFLIHPNARSIPDSPIVGESQDIKRSDLVARGYDKDLVWSLKCDDTGDDDAKERRGDDWAQVDSDVAKAMETVKISDVIIQHDSDGDGIAELHHVICGDGVVTSGSDARLVILHSEIVSEINYADVVSERDAHEFEGHSLAEDMIETQKITTTLLRQAINNLMWVNNPQMAARYDMVENPEAILKPRFGKPILMKAGVSNVNEAISWHQPPFIADKAFGAIEAIKAEAKERTGITDASGGLTPEQLTNTSATATAIINDAATAQAEMMIRSVARGGIKKAFRGLLRLIVANADQERTIRLRGQWVTFDPRAWDADMDCAVNVGLGGGSREADLMMMQMIVSKQEMILSNYGPDNGIVTLEQYYNALAKMVEIAGMPGADPYFTRPDMEAMAQKQAQAGEQPSPEEMKAQAQMQVEMAKAQAREQVEAAQMEADLVVKRAELEAEAALEQQKMQHELQLKSMQRELDLLKHRDTMQLEYAKLRGQREQSEANILDAQQRAQAQNIGKALNVPA